MPRITKEDLRNIHTYSLSSRKSLVTREDFGEVSESGVSLANFLKRLPNIYMAKDLLRVSQKVRQVREERGVAHLSLGSHVIKNGLSPYLVDLMRQGFLSALSFNGSALIHEFEIATVGHTSEDVGKSIEQGKFGLVRETAESLGEAIRESEEKALGLGEAVGRYLLKKAPYAHLSLLAQAVKYKVAATVHIAIGTDTIHMHPSFQASLAAEASHRDFLKFASSVAGLRNGIYLNVGSAVILPEVFLKALSLARNLGHRVEDFWAVNLDFNRHYRTKRNVLERPTQEKGSQAIEIIGPHELILPLLHGAIVESIDPNEAT